jgi:hypothetical protein
VTRLRVAVDATAVPARLTGAGIYVARVLAALAARDDLEVQAFCAPGSARVLAAPGLSLRPVRAAGAGRPARIAWTQLLAGRAARGGGADLLHGVHYELPLWAGLPRVVTVHDLTLVTHPEWHERAKVRYFGWALRRAVAASGVADRILVPGYVPEADKAALLTGADVFAYPSRYEGFGLPVLEAMACGTPVVTTTGGSLPEVAGDAATLIEPGDADALAAALAKLAADPAARQDAAARGRQRAATFTWEHCATRTAAAYRRAAAA